MRFAKGICFLLLTVAAFHPAQTPAQAPGSDLPSAAQPLAPLFLADDSLDAASSFRTEAQLEILELAATVGTDLKDLISIIITDNAEVLDHIIVNLAGQRIYECNVNGEVLRSEPVSTGTRGYDTPPGEYHVVNRAQKAYSQKYEAWMLHWMGITSDGGYGMHGLEGSSYERLLGRVASHGCIRLSRTYAEDLYGRIRIGLPVTIVNDPQLELPEYLPLSKRAAEAMVLELISPADPWEVFY